MIGRRLAVWIAAITLAWTSCSVAHAGEAEWKILNDQVVPHLMGGAVRQAEQFARQAVAEAEKTFGPSHRNTESSLANLALVLRFEKRFEESEKTYRRALMIRERALGAGHPATALMMSNLADVLQAQRKLPEAETLQRRVLGIFEKAYGDDPKTATVLNNLGANLQTQERYKEAEPLLLRALAMKEKTLGAEHLSLAHTLTNLAEVSEALGRKDEAAKYRTRADTLRVQAMGADNKPAGKAKP